MSSPPITGDVVQKFNHPAVAEDNTVLPAFPTVATALDKYAKRVPWWGWLLVGLGIGTGLFGRVLPSLTSLFTRRSGD